MEIKSVPRSTLTDNAPTNIFIPGLSNNKFETTKSIQMLENAGVNNLIIFDIKKVLRKISSGFYFDSALYEQLKKGTDGKVNLICHSMGCNYGISAISAFELANKMKSANESDLNKIIFLSPEIWPISPEEQLLIDERNSKTNNFGERQISTSFLSKIDIRKLKWLKEFLRTQEIARKALIDGFENVPETMIAYSTGDRFVSPKGIEQMQLYLGRTSEVVEVESTMHNPLLSDEYGPVLSKKISTFLKK